MGSLLQIVRGITSREDHDRPHEQRGVTGYLRAAWQRKGHIPSGRIVIGKFMYAGVESGQDQRNDLDAEISAVKTLDRLRPEQENAGGYHESKTRERDGHELRLHFRYRILGP